MSESKTLTGQLSVSIQLSFLARATSHCNRIVLVVVLRVLPFKVHSFHPLRPIPCVIQTLFHLYQEIPFSHPFNLDGSFHTTVCTLPWQHNERPSVAPLRTCRLLSAEKLVVRLEPFVTNLQGGGIARSFKLYLAFFSLSHTGYFSLSYTFRRDKSNPMSLPLNAWLFSPDIQFGCRLHS